MISRDAPSPAKLTPEHAVVDKPRVQFGLVSYSSHTNPVGDFHPKLYTGQLQEVEHTLISVVLSKHHIEVLTACSGMDTHTVTHREHPLASVTYLRRKSLRVPAMTFGSIVSIRSMQVMMKLLSSSHWY